MNFRTIVLSLTVLAIGALAVLNWGALVTPTAVSLGVTTVEAPLGLVMLIVTGIVSGLFLVYILLQQAGVIMESRRATKELNAQRELADRAEASRFTEMRAFLDGELRKLEAQSAAQQRQTAERLEQLDARMHAQIGEMARTLSAYVGEVEDKIDRVLPQIPALPR